MSIRPGKNCSGEVGSSNPIELCRVCHARLFKVEDPRFGISLGSYSSARMAACFLARLGWKFPTPVIREVHGENWYVRNQLALESERVESERGGVSGLRYLRDEPRAIGSRRCRGAAVGPLGQTRPQPQTVG